MDKETTKGHLAGIGSLAIAMVFGIVTKTIGVSDISGRIMVGFTLIFAVLSIGSFWKPKTIGKVTAKFLDNIAESMAEEKRPDQTQHKTKNSNQAGRDIHIKNMYFGPKRRKRF